MHILYIHNDYAKPSGEETAAEAIVALLKEHGHEVEWHRRSSAEIAGSFWGQIKSLFTGLVNPCEAKAVIKHIQDFKPDLVQVQNIYPLLSPSIFPAIRKCGVPIVMRCPNYRLFCPNGLCCDMQGHVCEECFGGHEWRCAIKNCTGSRLKSIGYALRGWAARVTRRILDNVDVFIVQTEFQRQKFIQQGILEERLAILPGIMQNVEPPSEWQAGKYITYIGRCSEEKGIIEFIECARRLPCITFMVAGSYDGMPHLKENSPANVTWTGFLKGEVLRQAFLDSRMVVVPSRCYEGFPNTIVQAMQLERPVITVDLGSSGSIVQEGSTGEKFRPMDVEDLSRKVASLYSDVERCRRYGKAGRSEALRLYSRESIYARLMDIYEIAMKNAKVK
ncbi:MAG: Alpha-D-kanosaminyltransferase [Lentisphaerae bacterium ADurb.Bin082]|nr:MAG: Alpha-D-kanosaminyltransferase [Lentisphaerae bacterium ADurb.Bin082]